MKLYHCKSSRSFRVLWAMEELGVEAEVITLAFPPRVREPEFLDLNPAGTIPFFVDGEVRMSESMAIVEYLAEIAEPNDLAVKPGEPGRADYLNFVHLGEATLVPPLTTVMRYHILAPREGRKPEVVADHMAVLADRLKPVEAQLARGEWMAAGRFTAADISVGYALFLAELFRKSDLFAPAVAAYLARLKARPAFERAMARNG